MSLIVPDKKLILPDEYDDSYHLKYVSPPTIGKFMQSNAFIRGLRGPIGSGKSSGSAMEIFRRASLQEHNNLGGIKKRRTRFAVVRNTNNQLETTTVKTWLDWFPENIFGRFYMRYPMRHYIRYKDIESEVWFIALDKPDDIKKLLSLELTGAWVNEARETPYEIIEMLTGRVGRYPAEKDGGQTWSGVIMDTNSPEDDHWWAILEGVAPVPDNWAPPEDVEMFIQPPAMFEKRDGKEIKWELNLNAENLANLNPKYYQRYASGKPQSKIRIYIGNKYGTDTEGKQVYDEFNEDVHVAKEPLKRIPGGIIIVGLDFGRTPAACFSQRTARGQWQDIHELVTQNMGAERFAVLLKQECASVFPGCNFQFWGDPSGGHGGQIDERTYFDVLRANGTKVRAAPAQNWTIRREAGAASLNRMIDGFPGYLCSPTCKNLIKGFKNGFKFRRLNVSGQPRYTELPEKNIYSHIHEARQYGYCGGGEARELIRDKSGKKQKVRKAKIKIPIHKRRR